MHHDFWQAKWQQNQQGFDQDTPNTLLSKHFKALNVPNGGRVLVPLCGKSVDMLWLAGQEYEVIGVELVEDAVIDFFKQNNIQATLSPHATNDTIKRYSGRFNGQLIEIWIGDIFDLTPADVGKIDAIYDRAAIVALSDNDADNLRTQYTQQLITLTDNAPQLVILLGYDDKQDESIYQQLLQREHPPFLVTPQQFEDYYSKHYNIELLAKESADVFTNHGESGRQLAYALYPAKTGL